MKIASGKYTIELFAEKHNLTRDSAINKLSKLRKQGYAKVSGGGKQKRIYTVSNKKIREPNGFFKILNKYSPEKINPSFQHYVFGKYTIEKTIIDGLLISDNIRIRKAMYYLFNHIKNWKRLFELAKKYKLEKEVKKLYKEARTKVRVKKMPER